MSNFNCDICGLPILEDKKGNYITGCKHYPLEILNFKPMNTKLVEKNIAMWKQELNIITKIINKEKKEK